MADYVTERRIAKDKIFKTKSFYLVNIDRILGIDSNQDTVEHCSSIIKTLITKYHYFGEYSTGSINAFLEIYRKAQNGNNIEYAKLQHLEYSITDAKPLVDLMKYMLIIHFIN